MRLTVEKAFRKGKRFILNGMEYACTEFDICSMELGSIMSARWCFDNRKNKVKEIHRDGYDIINNKCKKVK